jgi:hypothetical protein
MSQVITAPPAHAAPGPPPPPASPLRLVRRIGYAVLGLQLICFLAWSTILYRRFALTYDFAIYNQAWFLIAHGTFDPYSTLGSLPFWRSDSEFLPWLLAPLYWVWPHDVLLLWLQDASVVVAEAVAFSWLRELAERHRPGRDAAWLAGAGLVLLVANPWTWWAVSFDFHEEALAIPFAVLLARDVAGGRRRAWAWVAPILAAGAPSAVYVAGIGLGGLLAGRRSRVAGTLMVCLGAGYSLLIVLVHGDVGFPLSRAYGYLATGVPPGYVTAKLTTVGLVKGLVSHPSGVLRAFWTKRADVVANLAPAGLLGLGSPMVLPLMLLILLANTLMPGVLFAEPLFQSLPVYVLMPVGTVAVLTWLARRHRRWALLLAGLVVTQALGWTAVWLPRVPGQWLRVPGPTAATLASVAASIPGSAEVIASQGVMGRFSGRADLRPLSGPGVIPVVGREIWFVIVAAAGIEIQSTASAMALAGELAGPLHATLVTHANGVWAFRWRPPTGVHTMTVPDGSNPIPAGAASGAAGRDVMAGPVAGWHATSTGGEGYVADGIAWQQPPGRYTALVTLSATGPVNVEVWNDTGDTLLARRSLPGTTGIESVVLPVDATAAYRASVYSGWGPFRADFVPPPAGERLEVRVWSPGSEAVNVYSARLIP